MSAEDFKSEILAIDLKSGHYYSLRDSAAQIWRLLIEGHSVEAVIPWVAAYYGVEAAAVAPDVKGFIAELEALRLIVANPDPSPGPTLVAPGPGGDIYAKPVLETYTDLQDLLLLDPIHEVDVAGWPHKKADPA